jgi:hypothetical protein
VWLVNTGAWTRDLRTRTGRPHWLVIDEAHHMLPASWHPASELPLRPHGTLYITVHPGSVAPAIIKTIETLVVIGEHVDETVREFCKVGGLAPPRLAATGKIPTGQALHWIPETATNDMNPQPAYEPSAPWTLPAAETQRPPLATDLQADVCVVGAGIAGLTTAHLLAREGLRVAVIDRAGIGGGETQRTTAHLASAIDDRILEIERIHGAEGARLAVESHAGAIDQIEQIVATFPASRLSKRYADGTLELSTTSRAS